MDRQRITYQVKEMTAMERDIFRQAGHMAAPVVVTDSDSWSGFRPDRILTLK